MRWLLLVLVAVGLLAPSAAEGASLTATPATLSSVCNGAAGGDTILLGAGVYDNWPGCSKTSTVTLKPAPGVTPALSVKLGAGAQNLRFDGFTRFGGWSVSGAKNVTIANSTFTAPMTVAGGSANIVFDNDVFDNLGQSGNEGRLGWMQGSTGTVRNSHFGGGGCSDGIQLSGGGGAWPNVLIQGNELANIKQAGCAPAHVDPIQFYGGQARIVGNYFHNNSTGIMSPDGNGSIVATDNVFVTDGEYPDQIVIGGGSGDRIEHNTFANGARIRIGKVNAGFSTSETVRNNALSGGFYFSEWQPTSGFTLAQNPTNVAHVGGAGRCQYATASPKNTATDGTDVGISDCQTVLPPPPPPLPPGPVDPCAQTAAERDQALADLAVMTTDRDAWKARAESAEADRDAANATIEQLRAKIAAALNDLM